MRTSKPVPQRSIALSNGKKFRVNSPKLLNYQEMIRLGKIRKLWKEDYRKYLFELAKRNPDAAAEEVSGYLKNVEIRKIENSQRRKKKISK